MDERSLPVPDEHTTLDEISVKEESMLIKAFDTIHGMFPLEQLHTFIWATRFSEEQIQGWASHQVDCLSQYQQEEAQQPQKHSAQRGWNNNMTSGKVNKSEGTGKKLSAHWSMTISLPLLDPCQMILSSLRSLPQQSSYQFDQAILPPTDAGLLSYLTLMYDKSMSSSPSPLIVRDANLSLLSRQPHSSLALQMSTSSGQGSAASNILRPLDLNQKTLPKRCLPLTIPGHPWHSAPSPHCPLVQIGLTQAGTLSSLVSLTLQAWIKFWWHQKALTIHHKKYMMVRPPIPNWVTL